MRVGAAVHVGRSIRRRRYWAERLGRPVSLREIGLDHDDRIDSTIGLDFPNELSMAVQPAP
jgi:hypothetical protein